MSSKTDIFEQFSDLSLYDLEELLINSKTREESVFYRKLINLRLQVLQEKIVGETLL